jgi:hypothetical protein
MTNLWINMNDPRTPSFQPHSAYYSKGYDVAGPTAARMLAAQKIATLVGEQVGYLARTATSFAEAENIMEVLWHAIEETVRPFAGASVGTTPQQKDSEVPTSAQSPDSSEPQESRSSMKRKATQSS